VFDGIQILLNGWLLWKGKVLRKMFVGVKVNEN
jgi:hypothetical protein